MTSKESSIQPRQAATRDRRELDGALSHQSSNLNFLAKSSSIPVVEILKIYMFAKGESQGPWGSVTKSVLRTTVTLSGAIDLSPIQVFNAAPSTLFSAAAELAPTDLSGSKMSESSSAPRGRSSCAAQTSSPPAKKKVPSKSASGWLNLQWSLRPIAPFTPSPSPQPHYSL